MRDSGVCVLPSINRALQTGDPHIKMETKRLGSLFKTEVLISL